MKFHEYQGKTLFDEYGIPTADGRVAGSAAAAAEAADGLGYPVVVKAQVLTGGRGKAGGVKLARNREEAAAAAKAILSLTIKDMPVRKVFVVKAAEIVKEFYVGLTVDRANKNSTLMVSASGGMDIEELAATRPEEILKLPIHPMDGLDGGGLDSLLEKAFRKPELVRQAKETVKTLYTIYTEKDCSLVEINPYALLASGKLAALDSKIVFDDNALMKHPEIEALRNPEEYSADEIEAREVGLSFVSMDGDIGCIVNGAGLAMATMDLIKHFGGSPANFLDVGGSSNPEKVLNALRIILGNPKVTAILINIFGGITRCDDIAKGILIARERIDIPVPVVIRLIGTNDTEGRALLAQAGLSATEDLTGAVRAVIEASKGGR